MRKQIISVVLLTLVLCRLLRNFFFVWNSYVVRTKLTVLLIFIQRNYQIRFPFVEPRNISGGLFCSKSRVWELFSGSSDTSCCSHPSLSGSPEGEGYHRNTTMAFVQFPSYISSSSCCCCSNIMELRLLLLGRNLNSFLGSVNLQATWSPLDWICVKKFLLVSFIWELT